MNSYVREAILYLHKKHCDAHPSQNMIVVAPHPDDEVLGCGGQIAKSKSKGYDIKVLVVTDGQSSFTESEIKSKNKRRKESIIGCGWLGLKSSDIHFIGLEDKKVSQSLEELKRALLDTIKSSKISNIYSPHYKDRHADHIHTFQICRDVCKKAEDLTHFQYFVWYYSYWPWVKLISDRFLSRRKVFVRTIKEAAGLRTLQRATSISDVSAFIDKKKKAILEHKSQISKYGNEISLGDISSGQFIKNFVESPELYSKYEH